MMARPVRTLWPLEAQVLTSTADGDGLPEPQLVGEEPQLMPSGVPVPRGDPKGGPAF